MADDWIKKSIDNQAAQEAATRAQAAEDRTKARDAFEKSNALWERIQPKLDAAVKSYNELQPDPSKRITRKTLTVSLGIGGHTLQCDYRHSGGPLNLKGQSEQVSVREENGELFGGDAPGSDDEQRIERVVLQPFFA